MSCWHSCPREWNCHQQKEARDKIRRAKELSSEFAWALLILSHGEETKLLTAFGDSGWAQELVEKTMNRFQRISLADLGREYERMKTSKKKSHCQARRFLLG